MHYAKLKDSKRLQKLLAVLIDGKKHSTREIIARTQICAVNSAVSELRRNLPEGSVPCEYKGLSTEDERIYEYWMVKEGQQCLAL